MNAYPTIRETIEAALEIALIIARINADVWRGILTPKESEEIKQNILTMEA